MNTKKMTINAILIAIGVILHSSVISIGPIQPDFALAMLFIIMLLNKDYKTTLISGIIIGIFTALTTKSVGGQIPNIIDKFITCNVMYLFLLPMRDKLNRNVKSILLLLIGTIVSGTIYLTSFAIIVGLGDSILNLIMAVVLPTALANTVIGVIIYNVVLRVMKQVHVSIE